jgi:hypothetical protein
MMPPPKYLIGDLLNAEQQESKMQPKVNQLQLPQRLFLGAGLTCQTQQIYFKDTQVSY